MGSALKKRSSTIRERAQLFMIDFSNAIQGRDNELLWMFAFIWPTVPQEQASKPPAKLIFSILIYDQYQLDNMILEIELCCAKPRY